MKTKVIQVTLTEEDYNTITAKADQAGISRASYLRLVGLKSKLEVK